MLRRLHPQRRVRQLARQHRLPARAPAHAWAFDPRSRVRSARPQHPPPARDAHGIAVPAAAAAGAPPTCTAATAPHELGVSAGWELFSPRQNSPQPPPHPPHQPARAPHARPKHSQLASSGPLSRPQALRRRHPMRLPRCKGHPRRLGRHGKLFLPPALLRPHPPPQPGAAPRALCPPAARLPRGGPPPPCCAPRAVPSLTTATTTFVG